MFNLLTIWPRLKNTFRWFYETISANFSSIFYIQIDSKAIKELRVRFLISIIPKCDRCNWDNFVTSNSVVPHNNFVTVSSFFSAEISLNLISSFVYSGQPFLIKLNRFSKSVIKFSFITIFVEVYINLQTFRKLLNIINI